MTEVKESSAFHSQGLFATKVYACGDVILEECPIITLLPTSDDESNEMMIDLIGDQKKKGSNNNKNNKNNKNNHQDQAATLWNSIDLPSSLESKFHGTFRGMVQVGLFYMKKQSSLTQNDKDILLKLYHPSHSIVGGGGGEKDSSSSLSSSSLENGILEIAAQAVEYIKSHKPTKFASFKDWETLEKIMLIWACNAFQGGRLYPKISRCNHDCNPNAVIVVGTDTATTTVPTSNNTTSKSSSSSSGTEVQKLVAATDIAIGDEITISYLGLLLYAETSIRQEWLQKSKYFYCQCSRCTNIQQDFAAQFPCPTCHPREGGGNQQLLEEDVQYDDEQTVQYTTWDQPCSKCQQIPISNKNENNNNDSNNDKNKNTKNGGKNQLHSVMTSVTKKIASLLDTMETKNRLCDDDDEEEEEEAILQEHLSLASTIMGDKHWTTNLVRLLYLDRQLSSMSQQMLTTQELPEMEDVAEAIDNLQRICRFMDSVVQLKLDSKGHVLNDVIIGVARTLVSLGDVKSQKYAAEWLDKIADYVDKFENEGRKKVVSALRVAWKKNKNNDDDDAPPSKKAKKM